jgi:hypothetical protein
MTEVLPYAERERRKRTVVSYAIALGIYALLFGAGLLFDLFYPQNLDFSNKTLIVNIQGPVANDVGKGSPVEKKAPEVVVEKPAPSPQPAPKPQTQTATKSASTVPAATASVQPAPSVPSAPAPSKEVESTAVPAVSVPQEQATPWTPGERGPGSRVSSSESSVLSPGEGQVPWGTGEAVRITKAERGNSVETTLGGSSETVGQNLYVPIYLNMPLPSVVSAELFNAIPNEVIPPSTLVSSAEARKRAFLNYYTRSGSSYRLTNAVPLEVREKLWEMLEDAGYDAGQADYKAGRSLNPVVIGFSVTRDHHLRGVELLQSSGDSEVDASVLYGFKRASFWNKSGDTIQGRFVYRF